MAVKIRLQQTGRKNRKQYRIVAVDEHKKRDGAVVESIGFINPLVKPHEVKIDNDRLKYWQEQGAQVTPGVKKFLEKNS